MPACRGDRDLPLGATGGNERLLRGFVVVFDVHTGAAPAPQRALLVAALALLSIILSSCSTLQQTATDDGRGFTRDFAWQYRGRAYHLAFDLHPDAYEVFQQRARTRDYDLFASDYYSKPFIEEITRKLADYGTVSGLSKEEIPYFIVSFVQNLPYTSDDVTTGFDEYPRFPYETLYDNGGDCEDTSILASAMLHELGYDVALLHFSGRAAGADRGVPGGDGHMAVGIECRPKPGQPYYRHYGRRYCYLETTGDNWDVGVVPPSVQGVPATVKPVVERPVVIVEFIANYHRLSAIDTETVNVTVLVKNLGSHTARGAAIYVALRKPGTDLVWDQIQSDRFTLDPEATFTYAVTDLRVAAGNPFEIYVEARGRNFIAEEAVSEVLR